jgi:hypothetical protein
MANNRRRRYLIDEPVQLGLLRRLGLYALYCLTTATLLVFFWRLLTDGSQRPHEHLLGAIGDVGPLLLALLAILPFVAYDLMKLTNRFAGPVYRVRLTLEQLARGDTIRPVRFRDGDFWCELAPKLNVLAARLGQLAEGGVPESSDDEPDAADSFEEALSG